jgi:protein-tyrosine-phosphatase
MAEALFNSIAEGMGIAFSAGTNPAERVNPVVVEAMRELGLDISNRVPKPLTLKMLEGADLVVTMGCNVEESCPAGFIQTEDWELDDPAGKSIEEVRQIRDKVNEKVKVLIKNAVQIKRPLLARILIEKVNKLFRRITS